MRTVDRIFASSLQRTEQWLSELAEIGQFQSKEQAYSALHAVLQSLRDRLTVDEAAQLGAELPLLLRGVYYEGWKPATLPGRQRTKAEFLGRVGGRLGHTNIDPEAAARAVFELVGRHISSGELENIRFMLHQRLRELWPIAAGV